MGSLLITGPSAAKTTAASGDDPGTPGVSLYCDAFGIGTAPNTPTGVIYDTEYDGNNIDPALSTSWSPTIFNSAYLPPDPLHYTKFVSGDSTTFTVSNLPPHMSFDLQIGMAVSGTYESGDTVTMTGPTGSVPDVWSSAADFANTGMEVEVPDINGMSTASFTITANLGGTGRYWQVDGATLTSHWGSVSIGSGAVDVGGETDLPVTFSAPDFSSINGPKHFSDVVLNVVNYDSGVIQPLSDTVTIGADGTGTLRVKGTGFGSTPIILQDAIGDEGVAAISAASPYVISSGSVTEGVTSGGNGFTFGVPAPSLTDVIINFNTDGSTLPTSLMGSLTSGVVAIPAGNLSVFVPFNVADDGKIAPTRYMFITLEVPNVPPATQPQANMAVVNTDKPTITMNGASDHAVIPLDPQGDDSKLTDIHLNVGQVDGTIDSWTLGWKPGDFLMWRDKKIGVAGLTDLASVPWVLGFGAYFSSPNGEEYYTGRGAPPTDIYGQDLDGSTDWDTTAVQLSVHVSKPGTDKVGAQSVDAFNQSNGTANGAELLWNGKIVTDIVAGDVVIGQGISLEAVWAGPSNDPFAESTGDWQVAAKAASGYTQTLLSGSVQYLGTDVTDDLGDAITIHFYWVDPGPAGAAASKKVAVHGSIDGMEFNIQTSFNVWTPASNLTGTLTTDHPRLAFSNVDDLTKYTAPSLHFGDTSQPGVTSGITFAGSVTPPTFADGFASLLQLVSDYIKIKTPTQTFVSDTGNAVLDAGTSVPYATGLNVSQEGTGSSTVAADDTPHVEANPAANYIGRSFSAWMYLMWQPTGDSIPVALRVLPWEFGGSVTFDSSDPSSHSPVKQGNLGTPLSQPATDMPEWQNYYTNIGFKEI